MSTSASFRLIKIEIGLWPGSDAFDLNDTDIARAIADVVARDGHGHVNVASDTTYSVAATGPESPSRADLWDEGFTAHAHEDMKQRLDPTYPIHRSNPYTKESNA